jgi:hypothetical protein
MQQSYKVQDERDPGRSIIDNLQLRQKRKILSASTCFFSSWKQTLFLISLDIILQQQ